MRVMHSLIAFCALQSAMCMCRYHSSSSLRRASFRGKSLSLRLCHLTELLKHFTQAEGIPEYACDYCYTQDSTLPSAKKSLSVANLPNVLRLHIKRFRYAPPCPPLHHCPSSTLLPAPCRWVNGSYSKIVQHIKFPFELNMKPYIVASSNLDDQECVYDLSSVVVHLGSSLSSGHYISHCWNPMAGLYREDCMCHSSFSLHGARVLTALCTHCIGGVRSQAQVNKHCCS